MRTHGKPNSNKGRKTRDSVQPTDGDDVLVGRNKADVVSGGLGNDTMSGKGGNDRLSGDAGNDVLKGDQKNDALDGGEGDDQLFSGVGNDILTGGLGNDVLFGEAGKDNLVGGEGNDQLNGGQGKDSLYGNLGNDWLIGGNGNDLLVGADALTAPVDPALAATTLPEVDTLTGGNGKDTFVVGLPSNGVPNSAPYSTLGDADYVLVTDFKQPDVLQLTGAATSYTLGAYTGADGTTGTGIYLNKGVGVAGDLVAVLAGVQSTTIDLASSSFVYVA